MPAALEIWNEDRWDEGHEHPNSYGMPYWMVKRPDYPRCNARGFAKRSHVVWWLHTGQVVPHGFDVHHKDGDMLRDVFDNLELIGHGEHSRKHKKQARITRVCETCGAVFQALERSVRLGNAKYCSSRCFGDRNITSEQRARMSEGVLAAFKEMSLKSRRGY